MKKFTLLPLLIVFPLSAQALVTAPPDPCKGDTACQYRLQAEKQQEIKKQEEQKVDNYRQELLDTQRAQLEETQEQNRLLEEQNEIKQMEEAEPQENQNEYTNDDQTNS